MFRFVPLFSCLLAGHCSEEFIPSTLDHHAFLWLFRCPWPCSSPGWKIAVLSTFPCMPGDPVRLSSLWLLIELAPACVHLSSTGETKAGPSSPDVSQQGWVGEKGDHLPPPADGALPKVATSNVSLHCHKRHIAGSCSSSCPPEQWSKSVLVGPQHVLAYGIIDS